MFRLMVPVLCPFSGRYLHHLRHGDSVKSLEAATRAADRAQRKNNTPYKPYVLDDHNRIAYLPEAV